MKKENSKSLHWLVSGTRTVVGKSQGGIGHAVPLSHVAAWSTDSQGVSFSWEPYLVLLSFMMEKSCSQM